jgi:hypothetical protein
MKAQPLPELYTLEDYRPWEADWELIRGMALAMASSPTRSSTAWWSQL